MYVEDSVSTDPITALYRRLVNGSRLASSPPDAYFLAGLETRQPSDGYLWDGRKRGGDPKHPYLLLQITLAGAGYWVGADDSPIALPAGWGFFAVLPSTHRYLLPSDAADNWSFFWLMLRHPYLVTRLAARLSETGAVWNFAAEEPAQAVRQSAARLALRGETTRDPLEIEAALFAFLFDVERAALAMRRGGAETAAARDQLLAETRRFVENHLSTPLGVPDLAKARNMERSRYSHFFRSLTGDTPARFMTQVRLESASRILVESDATLDAIAVQTGFADANHLCKAFRRHYHVSPGAYRKQLR